MNYSVRKKNKIVKYIVIHYTGMKNLKLAYKKLSDNHSNVSSHYLISKNGKIYNLLCPKLKAWHAGESKWNKHVNINDYSIGIELENKGHEYGYSSFTLTQYISLRKIIKFLKNNFYILDRNIIYHSDISPNRKIDPGEKFDIQKIGIRRFEHIKRQNKNYSLEQLLILYGFHLSHVKNYKNYCIKSVKRSLNYKNITSKITKNFIKDFNNLIFK